MDADGSFSRIAVGNDEPRNEPIVRALSRRYHLWPDLGHGVSRTIAHGAPQVVNGVDDALLMPAAGDEAHLDTLRAMRTRAFLSVRCCSKAGASARSRSARRRATTPSPTTT